MRSKWEIEKKNFDEEFKGAYSGFLLKQQNDH